MVTLTVVSYSTKKGNLLKLYCWIISPSLFIKQAGEKIVHDPRLVLEYTGYHYSTKGLLFNLNLDMLLLKM